MARLNGVLAAICLAAWLPAAAVAQQGWGDLDRLLAESLSATGSMGPAFWLPDHPDPGVAATALGVAYVYIPGSAGSVSLEAGLFARTAAGWALSRRVQGLFGNDPRETVWQGDRVLVTTTTLATGEPRCCPTGRTRWSVDRATGQAVALR